MCRLGMAVKPWIESGVPQTSSKKPDNWPRLHARSTPRRYTRDSELTEDYPLTLETMHGYCECTKARRQPSLKVLPPVTLTPASIVKVREIMATQDPLPAGLRIRRRRWWMLRIPILDVF